MKQRILGSFYLAFFSFSFGENSRVDVAFRDSLVESSIQVFADAIEENSPLQLDSVVSKKGITVIRNFTSGTYGARGSNVRDWYAIPFQLKELQFPVPKEIPIKPAKMFRHIISAKGKPIPIYENDSLNFETNDSQEKTNPATDSLISIIAKAFILQDKGQKTYVVLNARKSFLLSDGAQYVDKIITGNFALFVWSGDRYCLNSILDLR